MNSRNPELAALGRAASAAEEALKAAKGAIWPAITAGAYRLEEIDKVSTGFTLGFSVPLWNANRPEIARRKAEEVRTAAQLRALQLELDTRLDTAYRSIVLAADQAESFERRILPAARETVALARIAYEEGETSLLDFLDAQRTHRLVVGEWLAARRDAALALAEIRRMTGGLPDEN
jgi:cobalt-zinc-cadmium efflux system outer membrane protein